MYFFFSWSSHQWFSYLCVLSPWWRGALGFLIFQVLHWKTSVNYSFTVHCYLWFYGFSALVFSIWQKSFKWFFGFGVRSGFLFFCVLNVTSHSADTVMIHVLIFSMIRLMWYCTPHVLHITNISDWLGFWKLLMVLYSGLIKIYCRSRFWVIF